MGENDNNGNQKNTIYGILDNMSTVNIKKRNLVMQSITNNIPSNGYSVRTLSSNDVNWGAKHGWYLSLPSGEMILNKPILSQGYLLLSSYIPDSNNTVCVNNQKGYIYALNPNTGGNLEKSAIDMNGDNIIDDNDKVNDKVIGGVEINTRYSSNPLVMQMDKNRNKLLVNTQDGQVISLITTRSYSLPKRRSWKKVSTPRIVEANDAITTDDNNSNNDNDDDKD